MIRPTMSTLGLLLTALVLEPAGFLLYGAPAGPSDPFPASKMLGAFLIFLFWVVSVFAWGRVLAHVLGLDKPRWASALAFGTVIAAVFEGLLGHVGLIGHAMFSLHAVLLLAGCLLDAVLKSKRASEHQEPRLQNAWPAMLFAVCAAAIIGLYLCEASVVQSFWDPLWYHLVGPRLWFDQGRIAFDSRHVAAFQCGGWEYLFLWGNALLAGERGEGQLAVQFFGQWLHVLVGVGGSMAVLATFFSGFTNDRSWALLAALAGVGAASLRYPVPLAKNDWGIIFWILSASSILLLERHERRIWLRVGFCGFMFGFSFVSKYTSVFSIIAMTGFFAWCWRDDGRRWLSALTLGIALGAIPLLLRNWIATGNPVFPTMNSIFASTRLGPTWIEAVEGYSAQLSGIGTRFVRFSKGIVGQEIFAFAFLLVPLLAWRFRARSLLNPLFACLMAGFVIFTVLTGNHAELRLAGALLPLWCGGSVLALEQLLASLKMPTAMRVGGQLVLLALIAVSAKLPLHLAINLPGGPDATTQATLQNPGLAYAWLRENAAAGQNAVTLSETRIYHGLDLGIHHIWDHAELDRAISGAQTAQAAVSVLRQFGYDYLVDTQEHIDFYYNARVCKILWDAIAQNPEAVVFKSGLARVIDLRLFESSLTTP